MSNLQLLAKGGLIVLIIIGISVLIERLTNTSQPSEIVDLDIHALKASTTSAPTTNILLKNIEKCLSEHSESDYFPINQDENTTSCPLPPGICLHYTLISFSELMESLGIRLHLIEPSVLFCLLPSTRKYNLLTRGFSRIKLQGSRNVMTFGVLPSEVEILEEDHARWKLISAGYRIVRFPNWIKSGIISGDESVTDVETIHYFIIQQNIVMHLIVFYPRGTYLWSPSFSSSNINVNGLQYVNNSAFEKFTVSPVALNSLSTAQIYIPSDTRYFLLDVLSSKFLECEVNISDLSVVNTTALLALKELKVVLSSQMVIFWLWSRSLQGWFEKCNVLHSSSELNLAIAAKSVEGFNFSALFTNSACRHIEDLSNLGTIVKIKLACHELSFNVFLMYEDENTYWYEHFDGENTYKLSFPKFTLCSSDVFGMKINIPCETSEIFHSEYGQFLKNTTLHLNPKSMKNVLLEKA